MVAVQHVAIDCYFLEHAKIVMKTIHVCNAFVLPDHSKCFMAANDTGAQH
jgi:hypothetical protein